MSLLVNLVLAGVVGLAGATGNPDPAPPQCGEYLSGYDTPGANLHGSGVYTKSDNYCKNLCKKTQGCAAMVRNVGTGHCYMKRVDIDTVVPSANAHYNSYLLCEDEQKDIKDVKVKCGKWLKHIDVHGGNLPGSGTHTDSNKDCWKLCKKTNSCNAIVRSRAGHCYMKSVDPHNVDSHHSLGFTSFYKCPTKLPKKKCGKKLSNVDIAGGNLPGSGTHTDSMQHCKKLCKDSDHDCNTAIRSDNGDCYLKKVDVRSARISRRERFTAFMFCPPKQCKNKVALGDECSCTVDPKWCNMKKNNPCCEGKCLPVIGSALDRKLAAFRPAVKRVCRKSGGKGKLPKNKKDKEEDKKDKKEEEEEEEEEDHDSDSDDDSDDEDDE